MFKECTIVQKVARQKISGRPFFLYFFLSFQSKSGKGKLRSVKIKVTT